MLFDLNTYNEYSKQTFFLKNNTACCLGLTMFSTIGGGLGAVIYIDVLQVAIMLIGSTILLFLGLREVGGWNQLQVGCRYKRGEGIID